MHRVLADIVGEKLADGAGRGLLGIGCAHHLAVFGHRAFALQHLNHDRAGRHEFHQFAVERARGVDLVEGLGLGVGHADAPLRYDAQAGVLDHRIDLAGQVPLGGVRLDDREGAFGHEGLWSLEALKIGLAANGAEGPAL